MDELVDDGFEVRGVFVTNASSDPSAHAYIRRTRANVVIHDKDFIQDAYVPSGHVPAARRRYSFDVFGFDVATYRVGSAKAVVAPLLASELVRMRGVQSGEVFDYNVRQYLGKTNVNKDIKKSVAIVAEHRNFLLYHNGITIVAESVDTSKKGEVSIANYVVVNGCQSVSVFWENENALSSDLRILARIIELDRQSPLMESITHHSNNQNGIKPRDFQSNSPIQLRLRNEFVQRYPGRIFYRISRGEESPLETIDNELAARILLAFDLGQPWTSHQTYKLFDDLHAPIFARPQVNADRILGLFDIYKAVEAKLGQLDDELLARYTLTKFLLVYLVGQAMAADEVGKQFTADPAPFVATEKLRRRLRRCTSEILGDLIIDLNSEVAERADSEKPFDFKRDLKSESAVRSLTRAILTSYQKFVQRGRTDSFASLWRQEDDGSTKAKQPSKAVGRAGRRGTTSPGRR